MSTSKDEKIRAWRDNLVACITPLPTSAQNVLFRFLQLRNRLFGFS